MSVRDNILLVIALFCITFVAGANPLDSRYLQSLANTEHFKIHNHQQTYHIYVQVPEHREDKTKRFPVVYLLDGGITFPMLSAHAHLLQALNELPEMIIVGISYGTNDWRKGNARSHDYTLPSNDKDRTHWGGAVAFTDFLAQTLLPHVGKNYPTDESKRILFGNSLGGQFGLYIATFKPELFHGIIASNPAIHTNTERFVQLPEPGLANKKLQLFVALAEHDAERFKKPFKLWQTFWQSNTHPNWQIQIQQMPGHSHVSSIPDAFRQGVQWILPTDR